MLLQPTPCAEEAVSSISCFLCFIRVVLFVVWNGIVVGCAEQRKKIHRVSVYVMPVLQFIGDDLTINTIKV